ncbi:hypothetical protein [Pseudomonas typographi]|uniref:hypothetical protein n=1 Tax=Pseudomonas typographi TaxID=2715964 RepID=UPI001685384D|nr:hypothetical protein [Pseudomonas typographi]MBD1587379.1 hypothetical protein [Pseudomonas typographi]
MSTTYQTIDQLLPWFRERSRTFGWDAIMALDRDQSNHVLTQEYIKRFGTGDYVQPISQVTEGTGNFQQLVGYRFDKPRVSFEAASLDDGRINVTLRAVGGTYLLWTGVSLNTAALTRIDKIDPFAGHTYTATSELKDNPLQLHDRQVVLDLKDGQDPKLDSTEFPAEQTVTGQFILEQFKAMSDSQTRFELSRLRYNDNDLIQPESLRIRTQAAPGAKLATSTNSGDGAVLVFVAMKGGSVGTLPTEGSSDWRYLLDPASHSALLVIANKFLLNSIAGQGMRSLQRINGANGTRDAFEPHVDKVGEFYRVGMQDEAWWQSEGVEDQEAGFNVSWVIIAFPFNVQGASDRWLLGQLEFHVTGDVLQMKWAGQTFQFKANIRENGALRGIVSGKSSFDYSTPFRMTIEGSTISFQPELAPVQVPSVDHSLTPEQWNAFKAAFASRVEDIRRSTASAFTGALANVNTAHLSNLLFSSDVPLALKGTKMPGDLIIYGDISPELTSFTLTPSEVSVMVGGNHTFTWSGNIKPTFTLEWADGEGSDLGSIDANGKYTAPATLAAPRDFVRVRVVAKAGSATSYALLTVAARGINANPLVQIVRPGATAQPLRGAALGGGKVSWQSSLGATFTEQADGSFTYTPPASFEGNVAVDEITASNGGHSTKCYVVNIQTELFTLYIDRAGSDLGKRQIKVVLPSAIARAPDEYGWSVIAGGGSITASDWEDMTYQAPATGSLPFALIELLEEVRGRKSYGYALIPQPVELLALPA